MEIDADTISRVRVIEELVAMLYVERFMKNRDPVKAVASYSEQVQQNLDARKLQGAPATLGMLAQAQFAAFFEDVETKIRAATGQPR